MEEILKQILARLDSMEKGQYELKSEISGLKSEVSSLKNEVTSLKSEVSDIKSDMGTKAQQNENSQLIKALLHHTEELDAKFDGLLTTMVTKEAIANLATKEDIAALDSKFEVLNSRLFHQEAELHRLKAVK